MVELPFRQVILCNDPVCLVSECLNAVSHVLTLTRSVSSACIRLGESKATKSNVPFNNQSTAQLVTSKKATSFGLSTRSQHQVNHT